jgi:hypothetical protein
MLNFRESLADVKAALELMGDYDASRDDGRRGSLSAAIKVIDYGVPAPIYGGGGFHRYFLTTVGQVVMDTSYCPHTGKVKIECWRNARWLGFELRW